MSYKRASKEKANSNVCLSNCVTSVSTSLRDKRISKKEFVKYYETSYSKKIGQRKRKAALWGRVFWGKKGENQAKRFLFTNQWELVLAIVDVSSTNESV